MAAVEDIKRLRARKARLLEISRLERHTLDLEWEMMRVRWSRAPAAWLSWPKLARYALPAAAAALAARRLALALGLATKGSMGWLAISRAWRWWRRRRRGGV